MESLGARLLDQLLLEEPWALLAFLGGAALGLALLAQRRQDRRLWMLALVAGVLAAGVYGLSIWVETPFEKVTRQTRELVEATVPPDASRLRVLLDPQVSLVGPYEEIWLESGTLEPLLLRSLRMYRFLSNTPTQISLLEQAPGLIRVELQVRTVMESTALGDAIPTTWRLTWMRGPDGAWRLMRAQWLLLWNHSPSQQYLMR